MNSESKRTKVEDLSFAQEVALKILGFVQSDVVFEVIEVYKSREHWSQSYTPTETVVERYMDYRSAVISALDFNTCELANMRGLGGLEEYVHAEREDELDFARLLETDAKLHKYMDRVKTEPGGEILTKESVAQFTMEELDEINSHFISILDEEDENDDSTLKYEKYYYAHGAELKIRFSNSRN